jgi:hypothetical protein
MLYPIESLGLRGEIAAKLRQHGMGTVFDVECRGDFWLKLCSLSESEVAEVIEALALRGRTFVPAGEDHPDVRQTLSCRATEGFLKQTLGMSDYSAMRTKLWMASTNYISRKEFVGTVDAKDRRAAQGMFDLMVEVRSFG